MNYDEVGLAIWTVCLYQHFQTKHNAVYSKQMERSKQTYDEIKEWIVRSKQVNSHDILDSDKLKFNIYFMVYQ